MRDTADEIGGVTYTGGFNQFYGYGRLNAEPALNASPANQPPVAHAGLWVGAGGVRTPAGGGWDTHALPAAEIRRGLEARLDEVAAEIGADSDNG